MFMLKWSKLKLNSKLENLYKLLLLLLLLFVYQAL